MLVALVAWVLHVAALALAPLSLVQAVISGGLVFLTVLAERFFGCEVGARQWVGVGLTAVGLVLLAVTLPHTGAHSGYSLGGMIAFEVGLLRRLLPRPVAQARPSHEHHGVLLGAAAGILFGVSDVAIKALTGSVGDAGRGRPGLPLARHLRRRLGDRLLRLRPRAPEGRGRAGHHPDQRRANVSAITGGIVVFGDPMPSDAVGIALQSFAFVLVIVAAALMPAPCAPPPPR